MTYDPSDIREWMEEPLIVHELIPSEDFSILLSRQPELRADVGNVRYTFKPDYARPIYEEDMGEVDPSVYDVYRNGIDWSFPDGKTACITGDVDGIPCEGFWTLDSIEVDC